ncbi:hypothetical protein [Hydrogenoanaerobacterium sp.]|uniref:hypothetical protein n=1 Tax=Hydrogenoanaerobacterium sp. TaxID=2953763 RepID=UPI0028A1A935|nr:hypothetical protein [Hydrogenoanaerobacterium sp.]
MINLIVLGSSDDSRLANTILRILAAEFRVACACTKKQSNNLEEFDFLLVECEQISFNNKERTIILCKSNFLATEKQYSTCRSGTIGVVQSDNLAAAQALSEWQIPVISCGMSVTDTLTLSSISPDGAVICLQRSIPTLLGTVIEPFEVPIKLSRPFDSYALMCIVAVLLLSDNLDKLSMLNL